MRVMGGRPVLLQRFPEGASGPSFFQKRVPKNAPGWLQTTTVATPNGTTSQALVAADIDHVLWAVNLGCLGFHVWPYLAADPGHADELRIDLDPSPGVDFTHIRQAAHELRGLLAEAGLTGYPKTTGNRGLHVYVRLEPRWDSYQVRAAAVAVARELERRRPDLITAAWWKEERGQRVFVDFNQNAPHKTVFGAWSVRARPGAQVSTPVAWAEIDDIHPDQFTIASAARPARGRRRPVAGHGRRPAVAGAAAGDERAGRRAGTARRAVAPGLPEAAGRAAPGRAQPSEEALSGPQGTGSACWVRQADLAAAGRALAHAAGHQHRLRAGGGGRWWPTP